MNQSRKQTKKQKKNKFKAENSKQKLKKHMNQKRIRSLKQNQSRKIKTTLKTQMNLESERLDRKVKSSRTAHYPPPS